MNYTDSGARKMSKGTITLRTDPKTLERLDRLAGTLDRSRNYLVNQALKAFLDEQAW
jgi:predicted transcriptional regulator